MAKAQIKSESPAVKQDKDNELLVQLREQLDKHGIAHSEIDSLSDLIEKLSSAPRKAVKKIIDPNNFARSSNVTSLKLKQKFITHNIPAFYLEPIERVVEGVSMKTSIFSDLDENLSKEEIWARIRQSGHCHINTQKAINMCSIRSVKRAEYLGLVTKKN